MSYKFNPFTGQLDNSGSAGGGSFTPAYWSGNHTPGGAVWFTTSATFVDPTVSGTAAITERANGNFGTVTTAASNKPGIVFTPATATAVYQVVVHVGTYTGGAPSSGPVFKLTDGTTTIDTTEWYPDVAGVVALTLPLSGIYVCTSAAAVTLKIQMLTAGGGQCNISDINGSGSSSPISWTLVRIA